MSERQVEREPNSRKFKLDIQEIRADLRLSFLDVLSSLIGRPAEFQLCSGGAVRGQLEAFDRDILLLHVRNLETPLANYPQATLRATDVVSMRVLLQQPASSQ